MLNDLKHLIGKKVKDFAITPIKNEFIIIFENNTALWFSEKPYAIGSVKEVTENARKE